MGEPAAAQSGRLLAGNTDSHEAGKEALQ